DVDVANREVRRLRRQDEAEAVVTADPYLVHAGVHPAVDAEGRLLGRGLLISSRRLQQRPLRFDLLLQGCQLLPELRERWIGRRRRRGGLRLGRWRIGRGDGRGGFVLGGPSAEGNPGQQRIGDR